MPSHARSAPTVRLASLVAAVLAVVVLAGVGRVSVEGAAQQPDQARPTFRSGVDVIQVDVTVLDKDRRPVRGLTLDDFTITEDGKLQPLVGLSEVNAAERDPVRSPRMSFVAPDVAANDLGDLAGSGRLFAIVIDDVNLPDAEAGDSVELLVAVREAARHLVLEMGPSDLAAIVFARNAGATQDFTSDRQKLLDAIDRLNPERAWVAPTPSPARVLEGDAIRFSTALMRSRCFREEPVVPALDTVVSRLAAVPLRRKSVFFFGVGLEFSLGSSSGCNGSLAGVVRETLRRAQGANINIYGVDPTGYDGYRTFLRMREARYGPSLAKVGDRRPPTNIKVMQDLMRAMAENTGGRVVLNTDAVVPQLDRILQEDASYYLIGYQTTNPAPDGKFRRLDVKVRRADAASVLVKSGYYAPTRDGSATPRNAGPAAQQLALAGMDSAAEGLPIRATVLPLGPGPDPRLVEVGIVLGVRLPAARTAVEETLTLTRTVYDSEGRATPPSQELVKLTLDPGAADDTRYEIVRRLSLAPGRYEIRYSARSALLDRNGTVYAEVEVPDFARAPLSVSGIAFGTAGADVDSQPAWAPLPIRPTTSRIFAPNLKVSAYIRVVQAGVAPADVTVAAEILDPADRAVFSSETAVPAARFENGQAGLYQLDLPLASLKAGPYLLSLTTRLPGGRSVRRDVLFHVS